VNIESLHVGNLPARVAFDRLVRRPLEALYGGGFDETIVILVDALDEALSYEGADNLVDLLSTASDADAELPSRVRLLLTSRPDARVLRRLGEPSLDLVADLPEAVDDVVEYASSRLRELREPRRRAVAEKVAAAGGGNFLYARFVLDELVADPERMSDPEALRLPQGLEGHYREYFGRELARTDEDWGQRFRPLLGLLAVARGDGLPRSVLAGAAGLEADRAEDAIRALSQYLSVPQPEGPFRLYHESVRDFLLGSEEYHVFPALASRRLTEFLLSENEGLWADDDASPERTYALAHAPTHAAQAIEGAEQRRERRALSDALAGLLTDIRFLETKLARLGVEQLLDDFGLALSAIDAKHPSHPMLALLEEILRFDAGFLNRHPSTLFERCWLRGWWWDAPEAAPFYVPPAGGWPVEGAPWEQTGEKLCDLVESWRGEKERRTPGFRWLRALRPPPDRLGGAQLAVLQGHDDELAGLDVSRDGRYAVSGSSGTIRLWDIRSGTSLAAVDFDEERYCTGVSFSPNGETVASGHGDGSVCLLHAETLAEIARASCGEWVKCVAFSPDGTLVATGVSSMEQPRGAVRLWEATTLTEAASAVHDGSVTSVEFSPEGNELATGHDLAIGGVVCLWRFANGELTLVEQFEARREIEDIAYSPDGGTLAWADYGGTIYLRNRRTGEASTFRAVDDDAAGCLAFLDGQHLLCGKGGAFGDAPITLWDLETQRPIAELRGHTFGVTRLCVFDDGRLLASTGDNTVRIWSLDPTRLSGDPVPLEAKVDHAVFSPDGRLVATAGESSGTAWARLIETGAVVGRLDGHGDGVHSLAFSSDSKVLACGCGDGEVKIWSLVDQVRPAVVARHEGIVETLAFSRDGRLLATGSGDGTARVVDVSKLEEVATFAGHGGGDIVHSLALSPDGTHVASCSWNELCVWDSTTGEETMRRDHPYPGADVAVVCFTDDGAGLLLEGIGEAPVEINGHRVTAVSADTGAPIVVTDKHRDAFGRARGHRRDVWRWEVPASESRELAESKRQLELVLVSAATREPVAWLPLPYAAVHDHPTKPIWAIQRGNWVFVIALEGANG
jgi:WD40 repeat protein